MHFLVSDDDEKDYSTKPEFYDTDLDDKDELWVQNKRKGRISDAVLSCPACVLLVLPPSALSAKGMCISSIHHCNLLVKGKSRHDIKPNISF